MVYALPTEDVELEVVYPTPAVAVPSANVSISAVVEVKAIISGPGVFRLPIFMKIG